MGTIDTFGFESLPPEQKVDHATWRVHDGHTNPYTGAALDQCSFGLIYIY